MAWNLILPDICGLLGAIFPWKHVIIEFLEIVRKANPRKDNTTHIHVSEIHLWENIQLREQKSHWNSHRILFHVPLPLASFWCPRRLNNELGEYGRLVRMLLTVFFHIDTIPALNWRYLLGRLSHSTSRPARHSEKNSNIYEIFLTWVFAWIARYVLLGVGLLALGSFRLSNVLP